jgi:hypothetical protein
LPFGGDWDLATTLVDADGRFTFMNIPPGQYTIEVVNHLTRYYRGGVSSSAYRSDPPPGWGRGGLSGGLSGGSTGRTNPQGVSFLWRGDPRAGEDWGATTLDVQDDVRDLVLVMTPLGQVRGRIQWPDGAEVPRGYVRLNLEPVTGDPAQGRPSGFIRPDDVASRVVDVEVRGIRSGAYVLRPDAPSGWVVRSIRHLGQEWADRPMEFLGGERVEDVVIEFTNELPTLSGDVAGAEPGSSATVVAFPFDRRLWVDQGRWPPRFMKVAVKLTGRYVMPEFPAGRYYIAAIDGELPPEWRSPAFLARLAAIAEERDIAWGEAVVVDLTAREIR